MCPGTNSGTETAVSKFVSFQIRPGTKILTLCTGTNVYRYIHTNFVPGQKFVRIPSHFGRPGIESQIIPGQIFIKIPL